MEHVLYILLGFSLITFAFFMRSLIILLVGLCITGVYACYPEHGHTLNDLLQEADKSMYKAKMVHKEVKKGLRY